MVSWVEYLSHSYDKYLQDENYDIEAERETLAARLDTHSQETKDDILRNTEEVEKLHVEYEAMRPSGVSRLLRVCERRN
jgi:SMC interacting uncharacterized protein involved in chromosome segregation